MSIEDYDSEDGAMLEKHLIRNLALKVIEGLLTDDNPSEENNLTGLEQTIAYVFIFSKGDKNTIKGMKKRVYGKINDLNGGCKIEKDFIPNPDIKSSLPEEELEDLERSFIKDLAISVMAGSLTDDNPSEENGLTGLEQAIAYIFGFSKDNNGKIEDIKKKVDAENSFPS